MTPTPFGGRTPAGHRRWETLSRGALRLVSPAPQLRARRASALRRHVLLTLDVRCAHDQCKPRQARHTEFVIFDDRLERAPLPTVVEFHGREPGGVEWN